MSELADATLRLPRPDEALLRRGFLESGSRGMRPARRSDALEARR